MTLRNTAIGIICATFLGLFVLLYVLFRGNIQQGFDRLERQAVEENLGRARNAVARDLQNLAAMTADWAVWDDTYNFLRAPNDAYLQANVTPLSIGVLRLSLLALLDDRGRLVLARTYDPEGEVLSDAAPETGAMLATVPGLSGPVEGDVRRAGLVFFGGLPCLLATRTVLTSDGQGPPAGTLVMGQFLDEAKIRSIAELTRLDARLLEPSDPDIPRAVAAGGADAGDEAVWVVPLDDARVGGYAWLRDIAGRPALVLAVVMPRTIHTQGHLLERATIGSLAGVGVIFGLAMLYFVERFILSRITSLGAEIQALGKGERRRVAEVAGDNEMSVLSRAVNAMLDDLDAARESYAMATRAAKVGVWELRAGAGTLAVDPAIEDLLGYGGEGRALPLEVWLSRIQTEDRERIVRAGQAARGGDGLAYEDEVRLAAADGTVRWFLARGKTVAGRSDGGLPDIVGTAVDITDLKEAAESIRALTGQLMLAQESERARIARDLHDNVAQDLSSLKIAYETMLDGLCDSDGELRRRLEASSRVLARTIASVRELSYGLRPPDLEHLGLPRALQRLCEDFSLAGGPPVTFSGVGLEGLVLDPEVAINVYRIAQEALSNARRHAGAANISVRLVESYPRLILRVRDDGGGGEPARAGRDAAARPGMGLVNMRERAGLLGGSLRVLSAPGQGTTVVAEIPYAGERFHGDQATDHR